MKRVFTFIAMSLVASWAVFGQNTQTALAEAAAALSAAEEVPEKVEKPKYWTSTVQTNINFGQTWLSHWVAGGYNNVSVSGNVDAQMNYAKDKMIWNNRLQLDYGGMYSADKPLFQKTKDRLYLESKWGFETPIRNLKYSASFDFKTQFGYNYDYKTPTGYSTDEPTVQDWLNARVLKSGFLAPGYINLGFGILWTPAPWFSLNMAPVAGGMVVVCDPELRKTYGMDLITEGLDETVGVNYKPLRPELGAQIKADASWVINDAFTFTTQVSLFYNYLKPKYEPRINWDNKIFWKLAKFFTLTLSTNLIYDPLVMVYDNNGDGKADTKGVQFKEFMEFGFTYSFSHKH